MFSENKFGEIHFSDCYVIISYITGNDPAAGQVCSDYTRVRIKRSLQLFSTKYLSYYPTKPYDIDTQKNHLSETILLSTNNVGLEGQIRLLEPAKPL